jgi:hypothetical protein
MPWHDDEVSGTLKSNDMVLRTSAGHSALSSNQIDLQGIGYVRDGSCPRTIAIIGLQPKSYATGWKVVKR